MSKVSQKMNIPTKINVGYQARTDTYTKKLAYVVYTDEKNKLRKEASWNNWRNKAMGEDVYDNVPTSGFVLNKKVGDYKSDWNHRMAHIRVYDPRGFEFEIGVENLLYILEECSSIKGKGIEGEFVYAWDKSDLILLPVSSQEFKTSRTFSDMKTMRVGKSDMVPGHMYMTKNMDNVMYLGHHEVYRYDNAAIYLSYSQVGGFAQWIQVVSDGKKHVFMPVDKNLSTSSHRTYVMSGNNLYLKSGDNFYWLQSGFTNLAHTVSDIIAPTFAEEYDKFKESLLGSRCNRTKIDAYKISAERMKNDIRSCSYHSPGCVLITKRNDKLTRVTIRRMHDDDPSDKSAETYSIAHFSHLVIEDGKVKEENVMRNDTDRTCLWERRVGAAVGTRATVEDILAMDFYHIKLVNDSGKEIVVYS